MEGLLSISVFRNAWNLPKIATSTTLLLEFYFQVLFILFLKSIFTPSMFWIANPDFGKDLLNSHSFTPGCWLSRWILEVYLTLFYFLVSGYVLLFHEILVSWLSRCFASFECFLALIVSDHLFDLSSFWYPLGLSSNPFGFTFGNLGCFGVLWGHLGITLGNLGPPWISSGPFGTHFGFIWVSFEVMVCYSWIVLFDNSIVFSVGNVRWLIFFYEFMLIKFLTELKFVDAR